MKTVLVVEDDKNQGLLYEQELQLEGYNVVLARDGKEAITKVEKRTLSVPIVKLSARGGYL